MSEASSDLRPPPASPVGAPRRGQPASPLGVSGRRNSTMDSPVVGALDNGALDNGEPSYPLDPPLVDVRIPVKAPHATATVYSRNGLMRRFPGAEVGDDLHMLFSEPGRQRQSRLSPDVFVALDVPRCATRADYDADVLGPPDFVLEVLSQSTWKHDLGRKLDCYQRIGVRECLLFDVTGEDLAGAGKDLWGFALTPERRVPLGEEVLPNGVRGVRSAVLGLVAYVAEREPPSAPRETWALTMRWHDPATGADIPDYEQSCAEAQTAKAEAQTAKAEAQTAKAEAQTAKIDAQAAKVDAQAAKAEMRAAQRRIAELEEQLRR